MAEASRRRDRLGARVTDDAPRPLAALHGLIIKASVAGASQGVLSADLRRQIDAAIDKVVLDASERIRAEYQRFYDFVAESDPSIVDAWHFTENVRVQHPLPPVGPRLSPAAGAPLNEPEFPDAELTDKIDREFR